MATVIYYVASSSNIVYIRDIWDTRMNPQTLSLRLK